MGETTQHQKVIALIEDEKIIAGLLVKKLEAAGYTVKTAEDGEAGVALVHELKPDLILLDMLMPRLDGFGVLEQLAQERIIPNTPLIVISNSGQPVEIERALKLGAQDYLIKVNFEPQEVLAKVNKILEAGSQQQDLSALPKPGQNKKSAGARILLVEDDFMLVQLLERKLLQQKRYKVRKAFDVAQAREILNHEGADIILLDIVLPGTDGFTFLTELKASEDWKNIPVIIMSNLGQREEIDRGVAGGAIGYIVKAHTNPQEIVEKIDAILIHT
jgi:DNA-binding response OmpR family regulator